MNNVLEPNGFTKWMRRIVSVICLIILIFLLIGWHFGYAEKEPNIFVLSMLLAGASMMFDKIYDNLIGKKK